MDTTQFCYWLQGLFELAEPVVLDARQTELVRRHLAMVFQHDIDQRISPESQAQQTAIHEGYAPPSYMVTSAASKDDDKVGRPRC